MWYRGKEALCLDLKQETDRRRARDLAASADVLVETFRPGVAERLGVGYDALSRDNPGLVYCSITAFGSEGPLAGFKAYEHSVLARGGFMGEADRISGREGAGFFPVPIATCGAFHAALQGIFAALYVRLGTGQGQKVETSLLKGLSAYDMMVYMSWQLGYDTSQNAMNLPRGEYMTAMTKDGVWLQFANNRPRLFESYARAAGLMHLYDDPMFKDLPRLRGQDAQIRLWEIMLENTREKTWAEWQEILEGDMNLTLEPFRTTQEGMDHRQMRHNGHVIQVQVDGLGPTEQVGPLIRFLDDKATGRQGDKATTGVSSSGRPESNQAPGEPASRLVALSPVRPVAAPPLAGVRALEFAGYYAAPYGPSLFADLGAEVIKVEPLDGEPMRWMLDGAGAVKVTQGKRDIAVELKTPEGQEILRRLIASADLLMHNYRPGAPERIGLGFEQVRAINPEIVYVYAGSYGPDGPDHLRPAFHPTMGAICGNALLQAGRGYPPEGIPDTLEDLKRVSKRLYSANHGNPDPNSALAVATAMVLGVYARAKTGRAPHLLTTMLLSNAYAMSDDFLRYEGKPERPEVDPDLYGLGALYRLYPAAKGWVFLACPLEEEWPQLCAALGHREWPTDPRFATPEARRANDAALAEALTEIFRTKPMAEWEATLQAKDISCVQADFPGNYWLNDQDEAIRAAGTIVYVDHPQYGRMWRHAPMVQFSDTPAVAGPGARCGEHTREVLADLGYSDSEIISLKEKGIVTWPE
jgi:crotonobetainyl-CoA:carnitine CoA-transferase CaiB-like acyl-CoA transferase